MVIFHFEDIYRGMCPHKFAARVAEPPEPFFDTPATKHFIYAAHPLWCKVILSAEYKTDPAKMQAIMFAVKPSSSKEALYRPHYN